MGYERSKFGNAVTGSNVTQEVSNHYGPRDVGGTTGITNSDGFNRELTIDLDPETITDGEFHLTVLPYFPAGSRVEEAFLEVEEAFAVSAAVDVGTVGTEATNGVTLTEVQLEAVGTYDVTAAITGTWVAAGGFTANTNLGVTGGGTVGDSGKARLVVRYFHA